MVKHKGKIKKIIEKASLFSVGSDCVVKQWDINNHKDIFNQTSCDLNI